MIHWSTWVSAGALLVLGYTYLGYPVVIALLARLRPQRIADDLAWLPTVSACVPVFNAPSAIAAKLDSLLALDYPPERLEILVFSDGSTDETEEVVRQVAARDPRVRLLRAETRAGKPLALNRMVGAATGEVLLFTDVRQPLAPRSLRALVARLADPSVGCVSGNLVLPTTRGAGVYWRYEKWIRQSEARFRSLVGVSGAIYVMRRADFAPLPPDCILDDMWTPMRLRLGGRRILFCAEAVAHDEVADDEREFSRKVRTLAGNFQLLAELPALLLPWRNPSWLELVSHKLLRLVCPFALVALGVAASLGALAPAGPRIPARLLVGGLASFVVLAGLGTRAGRLGTLGRTFVVLNAAAVVGLWRFLRGAQRVTW